MTTTEGQDNPTPRSLENHGPRMIERTSPNPVGVFAVRRHISTTYLHGDLQTPVSARGEQRVGLTLRYGDVTVDCLRRPYPRPRAGLEALTQARGSGERPGRPAGVTGALRKDCSVSN